MSEWLDNQKQSSSNFRKLLQERSEKANPRRQLTSAEAKRLTKLEAIADKLRRRENVQNRQLQTWLSEDEYAQLELEWQEQLELREELKDKPSDLKRYEEKLKQAIFNYNRAEGYSSKVKHTSAKKFYNKSESLCEDALELLQEILHYDSSLRVCFDTVQLSKLLGSEDELRTAWSNPITRRDLLERLEREGCYKDDLLKLQEIIDAENCDLFDVLEYIAYLKQPVTRAARVKTSEQKVYNLLNEQQREFVRYLLQNYVKDGVDELDDKKLGVILQAKYGSLPSAQRQLGTINEIRTTFIDFQQHLYSAAVG